MSGGDKFEIDTGTAQHMVSRWNGMASDLQYTDPGVQGSWPTHAVVGEIHAGTVIFTDGVRDRISDAADKTASAAKGYEQTDKENAGAIGGMKPNDAMSMATGAFKDALSAATGTASTTINAVTSAAAQAANVGVSTGMQGVSTALKSLTPPSTPSVGANLTGPQPVSAQGGGGVTQPASATRPLSAPVYGTHRGAHGDRAITEQQEQQDRVIPASGMMPGMARGLSGDEKGSSTTKVAKYKIVTDKREDA
jgi:hypothetical protein